MRDTAIGKLENLLAQAEKGRSHYYVPDAARHAIADLEFLAWFYANADFGPADGDVRDMLKEQYVQETGKPIPEGY